MKKDLREFIIKKTINLVARKGFEGSGMKEIAAACKMSPAAIYYYFESKHNLLFESIMYVAYKLKYCIEAACEPCETLEDAYKTAMKSVVKYIKNNVGEAIFYTQALVSPQDFPYTPAELKETFGKCPVLNMLNRGIESGELYDLPNLLSIAYSPVYPYVLKSLNMTPEQEDLFIDRLWHAISTGRVRESLPA